jgi:hypothetical protein
MMGTLAPLPGEERVASAFTLAPFGCGSTADGAVVRMPFWWMRASGRWLCPDGEWFLLGWYAIA